MAHATQPLPLRVGAATSSQPARLHHPTHPIIRAREGGGRRRTSTLVAASAAKGRAAEVVREFYEGVNRRDLAAVAPLIAEGCVYEDLVFPRPMVGRDRVLGFFGDFMGSISPDLRFVIDDISGDDPSAVGVTWHLEWKGRPFPFSRGCSFYRCQPDPQRQEQIQIVYGRDCVEPATKPGELALVAIRGVTWLLERFPSLADRL
ncbi:uncharacterized protein LOC124674260 [Lolium rigidum]|uniref:uncharacterized protein LOC124674260 n=1 Tax=Lolium rigidum TaxID=89674 RepID=UPI001F5C5972|nr:uncharacterized protein LOC124674260 [Lolium rigidum]